MDADRDAWHGGVVEEFGLNPAVAATAIANSGLDRICRPTTAARWPPGPADGGLGQIPVEPDLGEFVDDSFLKESADA